MTKYVIQDMIPSGKKLSNATPNKSSRSSSASTPSRSKTSSHERMLSDTHTSFHDQIHEAPEHKITHDYAVPKTTPEPVQETEIEDMLPENPRAMILEHLYEDAHHRDKSLDHIESRSTKMDTIEMSGSSIKPDKQIDYEPKDPDRRILPQFPSYKGNGEGRNSSGWLPWLLIPSALLILAIIGFNHFARAEIFIIAKNDSILLEEGHQFNAVKNPTTNDLGYAVMKVTLDDKIEVDATGTKTVTTKASGNIIVYNEQTVAQRLIKNTRFQSPAGKIYRINDSIVVPKAVTSSGKLTPGSIEVKVFADEAGPDYNTKPTDFSVPGLKDLPQYKKVYARSKGDITGGASGTIKSVSDQEIKQANEDIRISLETKLRSKARGDISPSQIGYDSSIIISLNNPVLSTEKASSDDKAVVTESGTLYLVVFDRSALTKQIAQSLIPSYKDEPISIPNLDALTFSMSEVNGEDLWKADKLSFTLSGETKLMWVINQSEIKKSLLGIPKGNFNVVMATFGTVERANASLRPFWKSTYPEDLDAIDIKIVDTIPS